MVPWDWALADLPFSLLPKFDALGVEVCYDGVTLADFSNDWIDRLVLASHVMKFLRHVESSPILESIVVLYCVQIELPSPILQDREHVQETCHPWKCKPRTGDVERGADDAWDAFDVPLIARLA